MNSFKNSNQGRRMQEWSRDQELSRQYDWINSPAYQAARHKAIKDRFHAYIIVGCAIVVIAILMFWP